MQLQDQKDLNPSVHQVQSLNFKKKCNHGLPLNAKMLRKKEKINVGKVYGVI